MRNCISILPTTGLFLLMFMMSSQASAVGLGKSFDVEEQNVPGAEDYSFSANSLDFTYHSCVQFSGAANNQFEENGYLWISSYQDINSVVDSQINYYNLPAIAGNPGHTNGYRIYGIFTYQGQQLGGFQATPTGVRLNYAVNPNNASLELFLDPESDTEISGALGCQLTVSGDQDDVKLGESVSITQGEKAEADGLANGDFELVFDGWTWTSDPASPIVPKFGINYEFLKFNGNITRLRGPLGADHKPEGSGNLFWRETFQCLPGPIACE